MSDKAMYKPAYSNSWALVIGINKYINCGPLGYACNDAEEFAQLLHDRFLFPKSNITLLLDGEATKDKITSCFLSFNDSRISEDDRIIVFYAGHGCTLTSKRGEVGYLVPVDGKINELHSMIRWDDFTRNADLILAKHMLFIMDACYGGLAVTRHLAPGSKRFLHNMMQRYTRQVLTAGKADEVVSDANGPRVGHSIFTGYLLDALEGAAQSTEGILTANGVMAYVYDKVSKDRFSDQTPHFGFVDGDGDLIFNPPLAEPKIGEKKIEDILIAVPASLVSPQQENMIEEHLTKLKEYLSDPKYKIQLDDFINNELRVFIERLNDSKFSVDVQPISPETIIQRLKNYEDISDSIIRDMILLGKWSDQNYMQAIKKIIHRIAELNTIKNGLSTWISLSAYPLMLLTYAGGIAALSSDNYTAFSSLLTTSITNDGREQQQSIIVIVDKILEIERADIFKSLPEYSQKFVPRSEYMFQALQPIAEDTLFLGSQYEVLFDKFELLFALIYADYKEKSNAYYGYWVPIGRFGWKNKRRVENQNPFGNLLKEADIFKDNWPPLKAGLFGGSYARFKDLAAGLQNFLNKLNWI